MSSQIFTYSAVQIQQSDSAPAVVLFAAPCTEMALWAGIPQKKKFGETTDEETVGFQRQENKVRVNELMQFYSDSRNVIQNPILCASRSIGEDGVYFRPLKGQPPGIAIHGEIIINLPNFDSISMAELFGLVRQQLEKRVSDLAGKKPSSKIVEKLKRQANLGGHSVENSAEQEELIDDTETDINDTTVALFEESHITDFWDEIAARHEICSSLNSHEVADPFLGFSRQLLISYLQPTVVVDGQHRLKGALAHANSEVNDQVLREESEQLIISGMDPLEVNKKMLAKAARTLPVSLLLSDDPAEQVFQFIVVNQKATPIGKALLGTIVSTTLGQDELGKVADRLKKAGIPLEESRAISLVVRSKDSPFFGKVQRGIDSNNNELLEWNVLGQLLSIFKNLEGGRLFGEANDYAELWKRKFLNISGIASTYAEEGFESQKDYWSSTDGPWLSVFTLFWQIVKNKLASDDPEQENYWGQPRNSNLFNKVSLTILSADFFLYLTDKDKQIDSLADVEKYTSDWLTGVSKTYFERGWDLSGVKKDTTGIKKRWASMWKEYRKNPVRLPMKSLYRQALS
jgi:hypothetical protein